MNENIPLSVILNELGEDREHYFNAVSPVIAQSSNFCYKERFANYFLILFSLGKVVAYKCYKWPQETIN
jgi:hypothetical protein